MDIFIWIYMDIYIYIYIDCIYICNMHMHIFKTSHVCFQITFVKSLFLATWPWCLRLSLASASGRRVTGGKLYKFRDLQKIG